jgi:hypothetical protein
VCEPKLRSPEICDRHRQPDSTILRKESSNMMQCCPHDRRLCQQERGMVALGEAAWTEPVVGRAMLERWQLHTLMVFLLRDVVVCVRFPCH